MASGEYKGSRFFPHLNKDSSARAENGGGVGLLDEPAEFEMHEKGPNEETKPVAAETEQGEQALRLELAKKLKPKIEALLREKIMAELGGSAEADAYAQTLYGEIAPTAVPEMVEEMVNQGIAAFTKIKKRQLGTEASSTAAVPEDAIEEPETFELHPTEPESLEGAIGAQAETGQAPNFEEPVIEHVEESAIPNSQNPKKGVLNSETGEELHPYEKLKRMFEDLEKYNQSIEVLLKQDRATEALHALSERIIEISDLQNEVIKEYKTELNRDTLDYKEIMDNFRELHRKTMDLISKEEWTAEKVTQVADTDLGLLRARLKAIKDGKPHKFIFIDSFAREYKLNFHSLASTEIYFNFEDETADYSRESDKLHRDIWLELVKTNYFTFMLKVYDNTGRKVKVDLLGEDPTDPKKVRARLTVLENNEPGAKETPLGEREFLAEELAENLRVEHIAI